MTFIDCLRVLVSRKWIVLGIVALGLATSALAASSTPQEYSARHTLNLEVLGATPADSGVSESSAVVRKELPAFHKLATAPEVVEAAFDDAELSLSPDGRADAVRAYSPLGSSEVTVEVSLSNADDALAVADSIGEALEDETVIGRNDDVEAEVGLQSVEGAEGTVRATGPSTFDFLLSGLTGGLAAACVLVAFLQKLGGRKAAVTNR